MNGAATTTTKPAGSERGRPLEVLRESDCGCGCSCCATVDHEGEETSCC